VSNERRELGTFGEDEVLAIAQEHYTSGRADIALEPGRTALIVIDMIDEFVKPEWCPYWVPNATRQVPAIKRAIDEFHRLGDPVIYLAYETSLRLKNFPATAWLMPIGSNIETAEELFAEVRIYEDLAPSEQDYVILKHTYTGFYGTELDLVLKGLDVKTVVIAGTHVNYCCAATAKEAFWHGYGVVLGSDLCSGDDPALEEAEHKIIRRGYGRVMTSDEILEELAAAHARAEAPGA
jgi:nicotinamidase-related amidase